MTRKIYSLALTIRDANNKKVIYNDVFSYHYGQYPWDIMKDVVEEQLKKCYDLVLARYNTMSDRALGKFTKLMNSISKNIEKEVSLTTVRNGDEKVVYNTLVKNDANTNLFWVIVRSKKSSIK